MECQICYEQIQIDYFQRVCHNEFHKVCIDCSVQLLDKTICCFCKQINPYYIEQEQSETVFSYSYFSQSQSESFQQIQEQSNNQSSSSSSSQSQSSSSSQTVLNNNNNSIVLTIETTDRNSIQRALDLLQILLRQQNQVQTRSMSRALEQQRRNI